MKQSALPLVAAILLTACAHPVLRSTAGGLSVDAPARPEAGAASRVTEPDRAAVDIRFKSERRTVQDLPHAFYEIRAMYTSVVVRSPALLADFHTGVMARPNSLTGYSLNVPPPGSPAPLGAPRLRYAQHPAEDDPYFPSLVDGTRMLNPAQDPAVYFLGQGILQTAHTAGFPPPLLDPFADGVSSKPLGSFNDVQSAKLGASATEAALNAIFTGVTYDDPAGNHAAAPVVQDRPLTDNSTVTLTRYYKWRLPFAATALHMGSALPLGRIVASGGMARMLQAGANPLDVAMRYDSQGLVSELYVDLGALNGMPAIVAPPGSPVFTPLAGDLLASYGTDAGPVALKLAENGDVWVANRTAGTVQHLTALGALIATYPGFSAPSDIAIDPYGDVWITEAGADQVQRISQAGVLRDVVAVGVGPETLAIHPGGDIWVGLNGSGKLGVFGAGTLLTDYPLATPRKVAIDEGQTAWTTSQSGALADIRAWDGTAIDTAATLTGPEDVAIDSYRGSVWISEYDGGAGASIRKLATGPLLAIGSTLAGTTTPGFADGSGGTARFSSPEGVAIDGAGNSYVADTQNHRIRKITALGVVTTLAGSGIQGWTDGPGFQARFTEPAGIAVDAAGTVYVADRLSHTVRKITPAGLVSTLSGSGQAGFANGIGQVAKFDRPTGIALDAGGTVYVSETPNHRIRKIQPDGLTSTIAPGNILGFNLPRGLAVDGFGNLFVANSGYHDIRKITPAGVVSVLTGDGTPGYVNGPIASARFNTPVGLCFDSAGNLYVFDQGNALIRRISPAGIVTTVGGTGVAGTLDGHPLEMRFQLPQGLALNSAGTMVVADTGNHEIRKLAPPGPLPAYAAPIAPTVSTLAGTGVAGSANGSGTGASFNLPHGVTADSLGNLIVCDLGSARIRKVTPTGTVTTLAGTAGAGYTDGPAGSAQFAQPYEAAISATGDIYISDGSNGAIRRINAVTGDVTTFASGFSHPVGVAFDSSGDLAVADDVASTIYKVSPAGAVSTFVGSGLSGPNGIAYDGSGNLLVGDNGSRRILSVTPGGAVSTLASSGIAGYLDGPALTARFGMVNGAIHVVSDGAGDAFVADFGNNRIRRIWNTGQVTTYAGSGISGGWADGSAFAARFNNPRGMAYVAGTLYVADYTGHRIRKITP